MSHQDGHRDLGEGVQGDQDQAEQQRQPERAEQRAEVEGRVGGDGLPGRYVRIGGGQGEPGEPGDEFGAGRGGAEDPAAGPATPRPGGGRRLGEGLGGADGGAFELVRCGVLGAVPEVGG
ncbi:hypothetical protein [Streptomyces sp. NBC_01643]|uniref:hypothetical protein n=1 Tax=Streptomyces sp. NBC_01643 TaxID=2975906 RepID=UPI0038684AD4